MGWITLRRRGCGALTSGFAAGFASGGWIGGFSIPVYTIYTGFSMHTVAYSPIWVPDPSYGLLYGTLHGLLCTLAGAALGWFERPR